MNNLYNPNSMPEVYKWITLFALSAMIVNSIGIFAVYKNEKWAQANKEHFMCFAAGMLISSPLIMAFPEAISKNESAGLAALAGFMFMYAVNHLSEKISGNDSLAFGITALSGIGLHSLLDGVIYSVTFNASLSTGVLAGIGLVAHEFAEGVITFSLLLSAGVDKKKAGLAAFAVAALTTPIGAFISMPFINNWSESMTGLALGFIVGVLIYVSAAHLLPEAENGDNKHSYVSMISGVALSLLLMNL